MSAVLPVEPTAKAPAKTRGLSIKYWTTRSAGVAVADHVLAVVDGLDAGPLADHVHGAADVGLELSVRGGAPAAPGGRLAGAVLDPVGHQEEHRDLFLVGSRLPAAVDHELVRIGAAWDHQEHGRLAVAGILGQVHAQVVGALGGVHASGEPGVRVFLVEYHREVEVPDVRNLVVILQLPVFVFQGVVVGAAGLSRRRRSAARTAGGRPPPRGGHQRRTPAGPRRGRPPGEPDFSQAASS